MCVVMVVMVAGTEVDDSKLFYLRACHVQMPTISKINYLVEERQMIRRCILLSNCTRLSFRTNYYIHSHNLSLPT